MDSLCSNAPSQSPENAQSPQKEEEMNVSVPPSAQAVAVASKLKSDDVDQRREGLLSIAELEVSFWPSVLIRVSLLTM